MPTVRLTAKIARDIEYNASQVIKKQQETLPAYDSKIMKEVVVAFMEHYNLQPQGEASMSSSVTQVCFSGLQINDTLIPTDKINCAPVKMLLPVPVHSFGALEIDVAKRTTFDIPDKVAQELLITTKKRQNIVRQNEVFIETLKGLLKRCTTIKQFIEAWPQGEQFVPQHVLSKHYEQETKRRKRGVYLEDEQLAALNDTLLTSKLT